MSDEKKQKLKEYKKNIMVKLIVATSLNLINCCLFLSSYALSLMCL